MAGALRYLGVDFSGAEAAGKAIWVAEAEAREGALVVTALVRAADLPGGGRHRDRALPALVDRVAGSGASVAGFDFPFALPEALMPEAGWEAFVEDFPKRYASAEAFRRQCRNASGGFEWKRETDRLARTPFAAYNLRLYRQTYYGVGHVLRPLIGAKAGAAAPMQRPLPGRPVLIEVCPASTLKAADMYLPYKGRTAIHRAQRECIVQWLGRERRMRFTSERMREEAVDDQGGDAIDALLALAAAARAADGLEHIPADLRAAASVEGWVYV